MRLIEFDKPKTPNPVAKNMHKVNRPAAHRDKKKDYRRRDKHRVNYKDDKNL
jgi:hypothetical protein